jgi:GT2 family glycosyltransferase
VLLGRMYRIFQRYADIHVTFDLPGGVLQDEQGHKIGVVDAVQVRGSRLRLSGAAQAQSVTMRINQTTQTALPAPDPNRNNHAVFAFDMPLEEGPIAITVVAETAASQVFAGVTPHRLARARAVLGARFLWTILRVLPQIYAWKWRGDLGARESVKQRLGLVPQSRAMPLSAETLLARPTGPAASEAATDFTASLTATLVMPIFNAFDMLPEALTRIAAHSGDHWRLILVEDCSSDLRVRPFLQDWAAKPGHAGRVQLLCNDKNLGFVKTVNRALEVARQWPNHPVVLLNSDVFLPKGWLPRLLAPLSDPSVASVTPMSNDAEIFTVPVICARGALAVGAVDAIDAVATTFNPESACREAPTGVGFCMALAPRFLMEVPQFDTIFGRGYGEETDWCQKTRALGGRHLGVGNLFVEHRGGTSFGSAAKQRLLEKNLSEITRRYPRYDAEVQAFIHHDPLATARLALALAWAGAHQQTDVPVYLAHSMGGGAEMYLQRRIAQDLAAVVLRVGQLQRWQIEVHTRFGVSSGTLEDTEGLIRLIRLLPARRIVYSCGVGDRDAVTLPDVMLRLAGEGAHPIELLVHDYFPISPSYTLLGSDGRYHGVPVAGGALEKDPAHHAARPRGMARATLAEWQAAWGRLIDACAQITVFCETGRDLMAQAYPRAADLCRVVPHVLLQMPERIARPGARAGGPVIGVLGNIGVQKGAAVVQKLSADLARTGTGRVVVVGHMDPDFSLTAPSQVHGGYQLRDLPGLVARYGISCWLIPSIWPETFSFTTHEALATGLPVFAFDLGAQGAAVSRAQAAGGEAHRAGGLLPLPDAKGIDPASILSRIPVSEPAI